MLVDKLVENLSKIEVQKKELHNSLYTALQNEDVVKSRLFYSLIEELEKEEKKSRLQVELLSSLN